MAKYIFITGGVVSSLGKGVTAASVGAILEARSFKVSFLKLDPYINVDPGTMSPYQHGEVFVTDDGSETDLDLGHYERFTSTVMSSKNNYTTGQIYLSVIEKERQGVYLGKTVQVIPHVTDEIKSVITALDNDADIIIVEIGGTVGDIESLPFLEAIRQLLLELGKGNAINVHLTLVPWISAAKELKTKPTQRSVRELRAIGISPDILICRTDRKLNDELRKKIALFCNVPKQNVIPLVDVETIYEVPVELCKEQLDTIILDLLNLPHYERDLSKWEQLINTIKKPKDSVTIGIVGKYVTFSDAYKSLNEALFHGGIANNLKVELVYIDAESMEKGHLPKEMLTIDGILIPIGFGKRGVEGKIRAVRFARENDIPCFGICMGMQTMVIEFARNECGIKDATSSEISSAGSKIIYKLRDLLGVTTMGGTMRLGAYPCILKDGSLAKSIYKQDKIYERHRHRYEVNQQYLPILESKGMVVSGKSPDNKFVEIVELPNKRWFLGCQFHPEYKSRPTEPHPLFVSFIKAAFEYKKEKIRKEEKQELTEVK